MPELPEVETMRRGILAIVGSQVEEVERVRCQRRPILIHPAIRSFRKQVIGQRVTAVDRIGKRVAVRLENDFRILFEPRMTGLVLVADPPSVEHLRFRLALSGGPILTVWYWDRRGLGSVQLISGSELESRLGRETLGPDALAVGPQELQERFTTSRREIKVALLDQRAIAGIGNLYAAEILHLARIHPQRRCHQLRAEHWERLQTAIHQVLLDAIRHEGSTLSDGTYRNAMNAAGDYQKHHQVYDREGELCRSCGKQAIERIVQAQRSTFYCRNCQPRR